MIDPKPHLLRLFVAGLFFFLLHLALLLLAAGSPLAAATTLERRVDVEIGAQGTVSESLFLRVRLEDPQDVAGWATHRVYLDENRELQSFAARVIRPDGTVIEAGKGDQDTVEHSGGVFYASRRFHVADLRGLEPGAVVEIEQRVRVRPYHPSGRVILRGDGAVERLEARITVAPGVARFRYRLVGPSAGLEIETTSNGVRVVGRDLPALERPVLAPSTGVWPVVLYGWGEAGTWNEVGRWYRDLARGETADLAPIRALARELTAELETRHEKLATLTRYVQEKVRYVAVEIGEGGYRPTPPLEVLERGWGDCKDKTELLVELLRASSIEAYPGLLRTGRDHRIELAFPSPGQFNHAIVALREPSGGYSFVDPTQTAGGADWLHPRSQGQDVLVVRETTAEIARTPLLPELEHRRLEVDLDLDAAGHARGRVTLELGGELAYDTVGRLAGLAPEPAAEALRSLLSDLLPGAGLGIPEWNRDPAPGKGAVPRLWVSAEIEFPALARGGNGRFSLLLPGMWLTPEPRLLRERAASPPIAAVVPARSAEVKWRFRPPVAGCELALAPETLENSVGLFRQSTAREGETWVVTRRVEVRERWIEPSRLEDLYQLALAEHRAHRRRLRLTCP